MTKPNGAKRPPNMAERLDAIELWISGMPERPGAQPRLSKLEENQFHMSKWMKAVTEMLGGSDKVQEVMDRQRAEELEAMEMEQRARAEEALKAGKIVRSEAGTIGPISVVAAIESLPDGTVVNRYFHFQMAQLAAASPSAHATFLGKALGELVDVTFDNGAQVKYQIVEIFELVQQPVTPDQPAATSVESN